MRRPDFDPRGHQARTETTLLIVGLGVMCLLGAGFAWWQYGFAPAICAVASVGGGAAVIGLLWLALSALQRWVGPE